MVRAVLSPVYEVSCQTPSLSSADYDFDATKMPGSPFIRLSRSRHTKTVATTEPLDFDRSIQGTQPIVRLAGAARPTGGAFVATSGSLGFVLVRHLWD